MPNTKTTDDPDARLITLRTETFRQFVTLQGFDDGIAPRPNDAAVWANIQEPAWRNVEAALALRPVTREGAAAQIGILADHLEINEPNPTPEMIAALRHVADLLATGA